MREFDVPPLVVPTQQGNLALLPVRNAEAEPHGVGYVRRASDGSWSEVTHAEFAAAVDALAKGFIAAGISAGDRVGLLSRTRYEWTLTDFALMAAGAVVVPVYETSSAEQVAWVLQDSGAVAVVVESSAHAATVASVRDDLPALHDVWLIDGGGLDELVEGASEVTDAELRSRRTLADRSTPATIIYTSGTTGRPKGCVLTHGNFLTLTENAVERLKTVVEAPGSSTLLFLPLAHVFARLIQCVAVYSRVRLGHAADVRSVVDDLGSFRPTFVLAVPRVFEKIFNHAEQEAVASGKGRAFTAAVETAVAWSTAVDAGRRPSVLLRTRRAAFDRVVYRRLRDALGGRLEFAISGGAPLGERLGHFFAGAGMPVLEGYGLTETTAPATVNTPELRKIGTVGPPLPGVAVRIADDGEVLVSGVGVFSEYFANPDATSRALQDGWLRTGDLGSLDADGFLRITGRLKDIIVTAGGKNVAPAGLEDAVRLHPLVSQCVVVGDQRPYVAALITLDAEMLPVWARARGIEPMSVAEAREHPAVLAALQEAVDGANAAVSRAESIRRFHVLPVDLTEDNGYLTPSLKVRRTLVSRDFAGEISQLYA
ncbi:AMP-dependent synthetase/ligase [Luteipulveratus halotolerans]|uniref:Acyl-CoA synthetase n=1 Tax=Luteipulveratus halotolerans TaxID=1631356 RepID=A0A0L6CGM9_9MICO|nr:AMP-dependent synthetase/ligase [Luteipulveratus halotolerans]KNX36952.1 long-chain fatty acid--CoA ligase [Luteipulveratus halotolerans]